MTGATMGELYVRAMTATRAYVDGVQADQWQEPTPCTQWDVWQVANHLIGENLWAGELFVGKTVAEVGSRLDGDLTGDDPATSYRRSAEVAERVVSAPGAMEAVCHLSFGDYPGSEYAGQLFMDTLVHGWDIASATGQDARLDPSLVEACLPLARQLASQFRASGAFGDDLAVSADAPPQTQLLALLGRRG
ncbi:MAG: TIGR03086 family protein [Chloroflexi bacterium]|nr:TIGR03086 family protein [Chloroflexota bacterium]